MSTADRERVAGHEAEEIFRADRRIAEMAGSLRRPMGLGRLAQSLKGLRTALESHFATEEEPDGFFDIITDRAPVHIARVEQLRREHTAFMFEVDLILDRVRACLANEVATIMGQAAALANRIEQHEASESRLLGEAMSTDVGAGDG